MRNQKTTHVCARNDGYKLGMVNDVLGGLWAESVIDGNAEERLAHASQIGQLPLGAVGRPQADTVLRTGNLHRVIAPRLACDSDVDTLMSITSLALFYAADGARREGVHLTYPRFLVKMHDARSKFVLAPVSRLVVHPLVRAPFLGDGVLFTPTQAVVVRPASRRRFERFVHGGDLRVRSC